MTRALRVLWPALVCFFVAGHAPNRAVLGVREAQAFPVNLGIREIGGGSPISFLGQLVVAWYRSDLGISLNGSTVSAWADQSGHGHHMVQTTAADQPGYVGGIAGVAGLTISGSNQWLVTMVTNEFSLAQPFEVFAVVSMSSFAGNFNAVTTYDNTAFRFLGLSNKMQAQINTNAADLTTTFNPYGEGIFVNDVYVNSTSSFYSINAGTPVTGDMTTYNPPTNTMSVGNETVGGVNQGLNGVAYEILYIQGTMTAAQRLQLQNYFQSLYGQP